MHNTYAYVSVPLFICVSFFRLTLLHLRFSIVPNVFIYWNANRINYFDWRRSGWKRYVCVCVWASTGKRESEIGLYGWTTNLRSPNSRPMAIRNSFIRVRVWHCCGFAKKSTEGNKAIRLSPSFGARCNLISITIRIVLHDYAVLFVICTKKNTRENKSC